jgi:peptide/nickel transport system permease protein
MSDVGNTQSPPIAVPRADAMRRNVARSQWQIARQQFARNRLALVSLFALALIVLTALLSPVIAPYDTTKVNLLEGLQRPNLHHPLGTDYFGRDVLSRALEGGRVSLSVGLLVAVIACLIGVPIGLIAGYAGGRVDSLLMRTMDALLTFPPLLLAIAIVGSLGPEIRNVMLALGIVNIPIFARLVRGGVLSAREELFVTAARSIGAPPRRILLLHILPSVAAPIIVQITVTVAAAVIAEASLSFLGLGAQPPTPSWGRDLNEGRRYLEDAPWLMVAPLFMIMLTVLSVNFLGDGLRDALDPRSWRDTGTRR